MFHYRYRLLGKDNKVKEGVFRALSKAQAERKLSKDGQVIFIKREINKTLRREISIPAFRKFSILDSINFFRNLATMLSADITLNQSLRVLDVQAKNKGVKNMISAMVHDIESGKRLSFAMKKHPKYFSAFMVESVNVGEVSGNLGDTLERISVDLERDYELSRKVISAMAYPIVVIVVMAGVVFALTVYVLPKIAELFFELGAELPLPTKILIATGRFIGEHYIILASLVFLVLASIVFSYKYFPRFKYGIHFLFLKAPIFGIMSREFNLARFFRALESLVKSGVSLVFAVEIAKKTLKNEVYKKALDLAHPILIHGGRLTDAISHFPFLFPLETQKIVEVGQNSGRFEDMFLRITRHYERNLNHRTQILTALLEPILMVVIGVIVGGIALSIFLPIYQAANVF